MQADNRQCLALTLIVAPNATKFVQIEETKCYQEYLTDFAVSVIFLNRIVLGEANSTHPLNALRSDMSSYLKKIIWIQHYSIHNISALYTVEFI